MMHLSLPTLILSLTLSTLLFACTTALAGPKPVVDAPALTPAEQTCRAYGVFAFNRAMDRNNGFSLTDVLIASRRYDAANGASLQARQVHELLMRAVYEEVRMSPIQLRHKAELTCLEGTESRTPMATPDNARVRY
jgi:hypothetical protein